MLVLVLVLVLPLLATLLMLLALLVLVLLVQAVQHCPLLMQAVQHWPLLVLRAAGAGCTVLSAAGLRTLEGLGLSTAVPVAAQSILRCRTGGIPALRILGKQELYTTEPYPSCVGHKTLGKPGSKSH